MQNNVLKKFYSISLSLLILASCNSINEEPHTEKDTAIAVRSETVTGSPISNEITVSGTVEGTTTVKLGFMVPGKIAFISCKEGEFISKGQLISSLEPTNYSLAKQLADVKLNATTDEFNRLQLMHNKGSLSESDYKKANFTLQQSQLEQKVQDKNLSDTRLYSPITGVLLDKQAEVGEVIGAGTPLFTVADIKKVTVLAFIPESELHNLYIGQTATISIAALGKTFNGKVTQVGSVADPSSRAFTVKMEIDNNGLQIRPGMIAEARFTAGSRPNAILLPVECVVHSLDNQSYVYVIDQEQHKAFKRAVSLGGLLQNKIVIVSGLSVNETIVISGQEKLSDGSSITVIK